ncbi:MAG TPA: hypothetical protein VNT79_02160 [Phycisphaerae bacterium]|nr:hypothetical protein [Phycisphaerae bacterium]
MVEWIFGNQPLALRGVEILPRDAASTPDGIVRELLIADQPLTPIVRVAGRDTRQRLVSPQEFDETSLGVSHHGSGRGLHVRAARDVAFEEAAKSHRVPTVGRCRDKFDGHELAAQ